MTVGCAVTTRRLHATSGSPYETSIAFSRAVRHGDSVFVSGTGPVWPEGRCELDAAAQTRRCFAIIGDALADVGCGMSDVVRTRMYIVSADDAAEIGRVHAEIFAGIRPAATMVVVAGLLDPRWKVEIEADAISGG